jgi:hypothetical protein
MISTLFLLPLLTHSSEDIVALANEYSINGSNIGDVILNKLHQRKNVVALYTILKHGANLLIDSWGSFDMFQKKCHFFKVILKVIERSYFQYPLRLFYSEIKLNEPRSN